MRTVKIAAAIIACAIQAYGAATVTASREYVDRKTTLHPSSNGVEQVGYVLGTQTNKVIASRDYVDMRTTLNPYSNGVEQIGYVIGTQTNKVLASKEYVDDSISASSPGDYMNVSNKAYLARSKTDLAVYATETTPWSCAELHASGEYAAMTNLSLWTFTTYDDVVGRQKYPEIWYSGNNIGGCNSPMADDDIPTATEWDMFYDSDLYMTFRRQVDGHPTGDRLATTNDIPAAPDFTTGNAQLVQTIQETAPAPGNYISVSNAAMSARGKGDLDVYSYAPFLIYSYEGNTYSPPVRMNYATIRYSGGGQNTGWISEVMIDGSYELIYENLNDVEYLIKNGDEYIVGSGDPITISSDGKTITKIGASDVDIRRESTGIDFATGDRLATTSQVAAIVGEIKSDRITDGTNIIDAARNVYLMTTGWVASLSASGIASGATSAEIVDKLSLGTPVWGEGVAISGGEHVIGWFVFCSQSEGLYYPNPDTELYGYEYLGAQNGEDSTVLNISREYDWDGDGTLVQISGTFKKDVKEKIGKLALTNDIPPAVTVVVPSTNATAGTAADAKSTGTALYTGFTEWSCDEITNGYTFVKCEWMDKPEEGLFGWYATVERDIDHQVFWDIPLDGNVDSTILVFSDFAMTISRHLVTPTKTSQLTNDGDGTNQFATVNLIDASNETFSNAVLSVGVGIDTNTVAAINALVESGDDLPIGGATSVGAILLAIAAALASLKRRVDDKASVSDLPYALVEPGAWEFSDGVDRTISGPAALSLEDEDPVWIYDWNTSGAQYHSQEFSTEALALAALSLVFTSGDNTFTATRASLPGHLLDRAGNLVVVSGDITLTLPEKIDGKSRDFYVRLTVSADGDGSAVTFSSTDSGGDAVAWDSMGDPSGTFAEGTYLYRITESDDGLMHAEDMMAIDGVEDALEQINDGTATPSALDMKLDATSAAPAFDPTLTYIVGEYVTYGGILYRCKTAVTVAGAWTGDSNWVDVDMTSPDATLDVRSDGRLAVVAADSELLWIQGYDMASASDVVLSCEKVNFYAFASGTTTQTFNMPSSPGGKVGDFVLDIDNSANASTAATATLNGFGTSFDVIVPNGQNLFTDILSFEGGEMCELYFTMTAFGTAAKPAWKVVKQVVEKQEAGS